jgi:putative phosphoesterase
LREIEKQINGAHFEGAAMIIGVIADTHATTIDDIPFKIRNALATVDLIVHAGDFTQKAVLDGLRSIKEVKAVAGNMDSGELKRILPQKELFTAGGKKIGLTHGSGGPWGIAERIREMFSGVDLIIYGHSHQSWNQSIQGTLMFNPGRARDSFGLIHINDEIEGEIIAV